jgi:hypothetical protein
MAPRLQVQKHTKKPEENHLDVDAMDPYNLLRKVWEYFEEQVQC